jgi:hypothetical protein
MVSKPPAIISLEDFTESINMAVYGDSGVGKTVLAGTCPNALFLAVESGTVSAKRQGSGADLWPINEWSDLAAAEQWLEDNPDTYDWVIIDSVTQMQKLCMRGILDAAIAENKSRDPDIPALQDWQKYYNMFSRFINTFNDLPVNVLYTATTMRKDDENGDELVLPDLASPSHSPLRESQAFCASMMIVAYYKKTVKGKGDDAETSRSLLFESMPPYFAKDRYDVFPRWVTITRGGKQLTSMKSIQAKITDSTEPELETKTKPKTKAKKTKNVEED